MEFGVLGPVEVRDQGQVVDIGSRMPRLLLAALLLEPRVAVSQDRLIDALWGEAPPPAALGSLHVHILTLRRALEPERAARAQPTVLVTQSPGYSLRTEPGAIDAERFAALISAGRASLSAGDPTVAAETLRNALRLWRGAPFADLGSEPFLQAEIARLTGQRDGVWDSLAEAELAAGEHAALVPELERLTNEEPVRERRWELLALALYRSGRQAEALRVLHQARRMLVEELGIKPGLPLRRLEQDILQQAPSLDWHAPVAADTRAPRARAVRRVEAGDGPTRVSGQPLVGRETELAQLRFALDDATAGHGRVALISGEPGIGKTRLAEELSAQASSEGVQVAWGRAPEGDAAPAYWPWVQIVRSLATEGDPDVVRRALATDAEELARLVPEIRALAGRELGRLPELASDTARTRLYDAVVRFVVRLAEARPLLVVIDDLHWADLQTLQLVQLLAGRFPAAPVLLVATYRVHDTGAPAPVAATLAALARVPDLLRVQPGGLTEHDVRRLVAFATGGDASGEVAEIIWARTEGNPFFVSELLQLMQSKGQLSEAYDDAIRREVPLGVRDVIRQRLARLPEAAMSLLAAAAVEGRNFDVRVAAAAAGLDDDGALELIEQALSVGVVVEDPEEVGSYRFSHSLVRETIYDGLSALRRARLHRTIGSVLVRTAGAGVDRAAEIADHCFAAGVVAGGGSDEAYTWAIRAADRAARVLAFEQAEGLLARAMELARRRGSGQDALRQELAAQKRLAGVLLMRHWYSAPEVGNAWTRAVEMCRQVEGSPDVLLTMWGAWCYRYIRNDLAGALDHAHEMRSRAQRADDLLLDVVGNHCAGIVCVHLGRFDESLERLGRVEKLLDQVPVGFYEGTLFEPDLRLGHRLYGGLVECLAVGPDGLRTLDLGVADARRLGRPLGIVAALILATLGRVAHGDRTGAEGLAAEGVALSDEHGFRLLGTMLATMEGWARADVGSMRKAIDGFLGTGSRLMLSLFWGLLAEAERNEGRRDSALAGVRRAISEARSTGDRFWVPELHRLHGDLLLEGPADGAEAAEEFRTGLAVAREQGARVLEQRLADRLREVATA